MILDFNLEKIKAYLTCELAGVQINVMSGLKSLAVCNVINFLPKYFFFILVDGKTNTFKSLKFLIILKYLFPDLPYPIIKILIFLFFKLLNLLYSPKICPIFMNKKWI